jgi:hypothetical protein
MASATSILKILIQTNATGNGLAAATAGINALSGAVAKTSSAFAGLASTLGTGMLYGIGDRIVGSLASIPGAFANAARAGIAFNTQMEVAGRGIAVAFRANRPDVTNFTMALKEGQGAVQQLLVKANESSADFGDLLGAYQANAGLLFKSGVTDLKKQLDLIALIGDAAKTNGLGGAQVMQETRALLTGDFGPDATIANQLFQGAERAQLKSALASGTAFELIMAKMKPFAEAAKMATADFDVLFSNMQSGGQMVLGKVFKPLFDEIKKGMLTVNTLIGSGQVERWLAPAAASIGQIAETARGIGGMLLSAFSDGSLASLVGDVLKLAFMESVNWLHKGMWDAVYRASESFLTLLQGAAKSFASILQDYLAAVGTSFAADLVGAVASMFGPLVGVMRVAVEMFKYGIKEALAVVVPAIALKMFPGIANNSTDGITNAMKAIGGDEPVVAPLREVARNLSAAAAMSFDAAKGTQQAAFSPAADLYDTTELRNKIGSAFQAALAKPAAPSTKPKTGEGTSSLEVVARERYARGLAVLRRDNPAADPANFDAQGRKINRPAAPAANWQALLSPSTVGDRLSRIGGFVGGAASGAQRESLTMQRAMVNLLREISKNGKKTPALVLA